VTYDGFNASYPIQQSGVVHCNVLQFVNTSSLLTGMHHPASLAGEQAGRTWSRKNAVARVAFKNNLILFKTLRNIEHFCTNAFMSLLKIILCSKLHFNHILILIQFILNFSL
jgi:hypothetical protein